MCDALRARCVTTVCKAPTGSSYVTLAKYNIYLWVVHSRGGYREKGLYNLIYAD